MGSKQELITRLYAEEKISGRERDCLMTAPVSDHLKLDIIRDLYRYGWIEREDIELLNEVSE